MMQSLLRHGYSHLFTRCAFSSYAAANTMRAWQTYRFGGLEELQLNTSRIPIISNPNDVLVEVHASSVNPLDVKMLEGYGASVIQMMQKIYAFPDCNTIEFPLTLGRDFSGIVVDTGLSVNHLNPGDEVWGAIGAQRPGCHAEYVLASAFSVSKKPKSLSHAEAASLPYVALTAWTALCAFGNITKKTAEGIRTLVLGASGGVGTFAVQLLKSWGAQVTATCSTDAVDLVYKLGAHYVIDYKLQDLQRELKEMEGFDLVLDAVGGDTKEFAVDLLKTWRNAKLVTVVPPLLRNTDHYGLLAGSFVSAAQALGDTVMSIKDGRSFRWSFFMPSGANLKKICTMVDKGEIMPVLEKEYEFNEVPSAYKKAQEGHARGKTVIVVK